MRLQHPDVGAPRIFSDFACAGPAGAYRQQLATVMHRTMIINTRTTRHPDHAMSVATKYRCETETYPDCVSETRNTGSLIRP